MPLIPEIEALERLLARKKQLESLMVSLDGYSRWGGGSDESWATEASREAGEHPRVTAALEALVGELTASNPAVLVAWADAHLQVLDDFLGRVASDSTEAFVARGERNKWEEVRDGKLGYVDENCVFVRPEPELYARLFGFPPPTLHW